MLATRNNVKDYMRIPREQTKHDNAIDAALDVVVPDVVSWCKRRFEYETRAKTFNGNGTPSLILDLFPVVTEGAEFKLWVSTARPRVWDDSTLVDPTRYDIEPEAGMITIASGISGWEHFSGNGRRMVFPKTPQSVRVQWSGGYWPQLKIEAAEEKPEGEEIEDQPGDIRAAVEMIVADRLTRSAQLRGGQPQGTITSESITGQQRADYADFEICEKSGFPKIAVAKLSAYRFTF